MSDVARIDPDTAEILEIRYCVHTPDYLDDPDWTIYVNKLANKKGGAHPDLVGCKDSADFDRELVKTQPLWSLKVVDGKMKIDPKAKAPAVEPSIDL